MAQFDAYFRARLRPKHLQLLVAIDDLRNLGQVAASINVTQPAVSKALVELERGLGLKLFERTARGMIPTIYGESLIRHARTLLAELSHARDELRGIVSGASGSIHVGVFATAALALLPRSLALLKAHQPGITVMVREGTLEMLLPDLWLGNLDLIVGRLPEDCAAQGLNEKTLMEEGVRLVAGTHHPLAGKRKLRWADLAGFPWVLPPVNTLLREPLERAFERHGLSIPSDRIETLSVHVIRGYLHHTDAIAALAAEVSNHFASLGLLSILPLELPRLVRPVGVVWSRQRPLSPGSQKLMQCLEAAARSSNVALPPRRVKRPGARRVPARRGAGAGQPSPA